MNQKQVMSFLLVMAATMLVASCGGKEGKLRSEFVAGCTSQGAPKSMCKCAYDKLEGRYGFETMLAMKEHGVTPPDYVDALFVAGAQCKAGDTSAKLTLPSDAEQKGEPESIGLATNGDDERLIENRDTASTAAVGGSDKEVAIESTADTSGAVDSLVASAIAAKAGAQGGSESRDARQVATGDVNTDGLPDTAAVFTIEVAADNTYTQYLAVFMGQGDGSLTLMDTVTVRYGPTGEQSES